MAERRIGQSAQDFAALAASAAQVYLTRSRKANGSIARPSRWVSRIKALAAGAGQLHRLQSEKPWALSARAHREPARVRPIDRPEPRPPVAARPRRLSVTAIETWFANPYAIYARHILGLEPLRRLDEHADARDKGILFHAALNRFFEAHPAELPQDAASVLCQELDRAAVALGFQLEHAPFWHPRFARFAAWFAETEGARRADMQRLKSEVGGKLTIASGAGAFEITARADRIDLMAGGSVRIYDFKTSANTAKVAVSRNAPQLALEGLLAREGAFAGIPARAETELAYIVATGGEPPGDIVALKGAAAEAIQSAYTGLLNRIAKFDLPETPYAYETRAVYEDRAGNDPYAHLARVQEWSLEEAEAEDD
jgi:ATP-dependent helicase/nuclease subunit B